MATINYKLPGPLKHFAAPAAMIVLIVCCFTAAKWGFANTIARSADELELAEYAVQLSPNDPQTRLTYAQRLENSFDLVNIDRALREYETAVALAPRNYLYLLALGRARERSGEREAAEKAYRAALSFAPRYAVTHWALGNNLLRQGRVDEGMQLIRAAIEQDAVYAAPAASAVLLVFEGDVDRGIATLSGHPRSLAQLAVMLSRQERLDDALKAWQTVEPDAKRTTVKDEGGVLLQASIAAGRFRDAIAIASEISEKNQAYSVGVIPNGGFEGGVALQGAGPFDWKIGSGIYPQVGLYEGDPREGSYSLALIFNVPNNQAFRPISITAAVEPGAAYRVIFAAKAALETRAAFQWEVVSAGKGGNRLAITEPLNNTSPWNDVALDFNTPAGTDGVTIRLVRSNCSSALCTVSGNLWFDDFRLMKVSE